MQNKALIFDPYLDTLGGGERYCLTAAQALLDWGWKVELAWSEPSEINKARERFNLELPNLVANPKAFRLLSQKNSIFRRFQFLSSYDLVFVVSDGSIPILFGHKVLLHYQVPFTRINQNKIINKLKLLTIDKIIVNSLFTKKVIDRTLGTNRSSVLYPPVDTHAFNPNSPKQKQILNVGRFASPSHSKRQDVLIEAFRKLYSEGLRGWKLILAGGEKGADTILKDLREQAKGLPVEFMVNPDFETLLNTYNESSIYWHAAGFEVDETINPEAVEHFGITTVEGMAAGNVPVVVARGGQKEIVTPSVGYLTETIDNLAFHTKELIDDKSLWTKKASAAVKKAEDFGLDVFISNFKHLVDD